jgi:hypothetical protein
MSELELHEGRVKSRPKIKLNYEILGYTEKRNQQQNLESNLKKNRKIKIKYPNSLSFHALESPLSSP